MSPGSGTFTTCAASVAEPSGPAGFVASGKPVLAGEFELDRLLVAGRRRPLDRVAAALRRVPVDAADEPAVAQPQRAEPVVSEPVAEEASAPPPVVEQPQTSQPTSTAVAGAGDAVENTPPPAASVADSTPVSVSSLKRTKYVAPKYPRAAQRRGLSGWVDVIFTVDIDGSVADVSVRDSNPGDTFVNSAIDAVEKWEFEPVIEDGVAVQKRAAVRMMFAIE